MNMEVVKFKKHFNFGGASYNPGDVAGFPADVADFIAGRDLGVKTGEVKDFQAPTFAYDLGGVQVGSDAHKAALARHDAQAALGAQVGQAAARAAAR